MRAQEHRFAGQFMHKRANIALEHSLVVRKESMSAAEAVQAAVSEFRKLTLVRCGQPSSTTWSQLLDFGFFVCAYVDA